MNNFRRCESTSEGRLTPSGLTFGAGAPTAKVPVVTPNGTLTSNVNFRGEP